MEKNVEISVLCQLYGKVLTEKQYEVLTDYYNNDLSLSEIAENNVVTVKGPKGTLEKELHPNMKVTVENNIEVNFCYY